MNIRTAVDRVIAAMMTQTDTYRATGYIDARTVVKATRLHKFHRDARTVHFVLTIGAPNFLERAFIKACKDAHEPLPVKKVQLKGWPKRRERKGKKKGA